jgi:hypothetical protein
MIPLEARSVICAKYEAPDATSEKDGAGLSVVVVVEEAEGPVVEVVEATVVVVVGAVVVLCRVHEAIDASRASGHAGSGCRERRA